MTLLDGIQCSVVTPSGYVNVEVQSGTIGIDQAWQPYSQTSLVCAIPDPADLATIDPRDQCRALVIGTDGTTTRLFNLALRARPIDEVANTMTLTLESDEALLADYAPVALSADTTPLQYQSSLRAVTGYVLGKIGATLASGTTDADTTVTSQAQNMAINPSCEYDLTNWAASGATLARTSAQAKEGTYSCQVKASAAGSPIVTFSGAAPGLVPITYAPEYGSQPGGIPGDDQWTLCASIWIRSATIARGFWLNVTFYDSDGNALGAFLAEGGVTSSTSEWLQLSTLAAVGSFPGASTALFEVQIDGCAANEIHYLDGAMITMDNGVDPATGLGYAYFDGATAGNSYYEYQWDSSSVPANLQSISTATRYPLNSRTPDLLNWLPGVYGTDFLQPLLEAANFRLFCDEQRVWRLVDNTYTVPGVVDVRSGVNAYTATDSIDLDATTDDGLPVYFDAVVVKYVWTESVSGITQTMYDIAPTSGSWSKVQLVEIDSPYPGPGAASFILASSQKKGHTQDLAARFNYAATPGMVAHTVLNSVPAELGTVSSVSWDVGEHTMTIGTNNLTED